MGRVTIKSNKLPQIIAKLPDASDKGLQDAGDALVETLKPAVWHRWGYVERSIQTYPLANGVAVGVGKTGRGSQGWGFYAIYNEFGTSKQGARPVVVPAAHAFETQFGVVYGAQIERVVR